MTVSQATTVLTIDPTADPRWDQLVERHSAGWAYHLGDWTRILGGAYGFKSRCLGIVSGGDQLVGALPMMSSFGLVTGKRLRSLPIVPPVDPIADSAEHTRALIEAACDAAEA